MQTRGARFFAHGRDLKLNIHRSGTVLKKALDGCLAVSGIEAPIGLGAQCAEEFHDVSIYGLGRATIFAGIKEPLVVGDAVTQLVDRLKLVVQLGTIGTSRPGGVQIRNLQVSLSASVGHMRPKTQHKTGDHLVGICWVMRPTASFLHGASVHQVDVTQFLCLAPAQDGPRNRRIIVEQSVLCTIEALDEHAIVGVSQG